MQSNLRFITLLSLVCIAFVAYAIAQDGQQQFGSLGDFKLESGEVIRDCRIGYRTEGRLNAEKSNAILFPTWLSGTSEQLVNGPVKMLDASNYYVIAVDALGDGVSSSPSTSALQPHMQFPRFTIADMVNSQHQLLTQILRINHVRVVMGVSMGGVQTFQWLVSFPDFMDKAIPIMGSPRLGAYDLVLWQAESDAITSDPAWKGGDYSAVAGTTEPGASMIAELGMLVQTTPDKIDNDITREKFAAALASEKKNAASVDANNRLRQFQAMIALDVSAPFAGSMERAATHVRAKVLVIASATDHTVTPGPALDFARLLHAEVLTLDNNCGHHAAECESERANQAVVSFLAK
jgi:homoserine O-acetyltransferase